MLGVEPTEYSGDYLRTMPLDRKELLVFALLAEGCTYYGCKDDLKRDYVPDEGSSRWQDAQTLEVRFGGALRPADAVDPRRFALLRYNAKIARGTDYYCTFDVCYRELSEVARIPDSLDWDSAEPNVLRLHFAEPIPAGSCEPWPGTHADFQALELIYLGPLPDPSYGETGEPMAEPDQLAYADDRPVEAQGPERAVKWLNGCSSQDVCEFTDFCIERGGYGDLYSNELWIDCP